MPVPTAPISVVMPVRNAAAFVIEAIESIAEQTLRPSELVLLDDGSTDETRAVSARADLRALPVRWVDGPVRGIAAAHNAAVRASTQPWVAVMHADDVSHPHRLERQWAAAQAHPEVAVWGTFAHLIGSDGRVLGLSESGPTSIAEWRAAFDAGRLSANLIHASALFRRKTFEAVGGYDEAFDIAEDLDLFERMAGVGPAVALPQPLLRRRVHRASLSVRKHARMQRHIRWLEARARVRGRGEEWTLRPGEPLPGSAAWTRRLADCVADLRVYYYHCAAVHYAEGQRGRALAALMNAAALGPHRVVPRVARQLAPVVLGRPTPAAASGSGAQLDPRTSR